MSVPFKGSGKFRFVRISPVGLIAADKVFTPAWFEVPEAIQVFRDLIACRSSDKLKILQHGTGGGVRSIDALWTGPLSCRLMFSHYDGNGVFTFVLHSALACAHYLTGHNRQEESERIAITLQVLGVAQKASAVPDLSGFRGRLPEDRPSAVSVVFPSMSEVSEEVRQVCQCCEIYCAAAYFEHKLGHRYG
jgi:hypothetical protein